MSGEMIFFTALIGIFVLFVTFFLSYGALVYWQERERIVSVLFAVMALFLLTGYGYVVINKVFA